MESKPPKAAPPTIDIYSITKDTAEKITNKARDIIYSAEREKVYKSINIAAQHGEFCIFHKFPTECRTSDILMLADELENKGFDVERDYSELRVSWWPTKVNCKKKAST